MNSILNSKAISLKMDSIINDNDAKDDGKNTEKSSNNAFVNVENSAISKDAAIEYKFLSRIEASFRDAGKGHFIEKYASEYEKIKDEIASGKYGSDKKKYMNLLDTAFKDSVKNVADVLEKTTDKSTKMHMSRATLIQCQKQYETATGIVWILRAENKRILKEIEEYRKKKDHRMVASLTQLNKSYEHVISKVSDTAALIQKNINDCFDGESTKINE